MNIEELKNNTEYADTYDGMDIEMTYAEKPEFRLLFDKCYFSNIFGEPDLSGKGWNGFTRDWQQMERAFSMILLSISLAWHVSLSCFSYSERRIKRTSAGIGIGHIPSHSHGLSDIWFSTMLRTKGLFTTLPSRPMV